MTFLYQIFGKVLHFFYNFAGENYGLAIVLFAIFAKIIILPLSIKQTRSTQLMQLLSPAQNIIQKKYANNKEKMNAELQKLYQRYNYNPLSGCLPLLIQFPIIIGLFGALRMPETYVFSAAEYASLSQKFLWIQDMSKSPLDIFKTSGIASGVFLLSLIIPLLSVGLTIVQNAQMEKSNSAAQQNKGMTIFMTVFIGYISFTFSQGIALYWTLQTALGILQTEIITKYFPLNVEPPKIVKKGK